MQDKNVKTYGNNHGRITNGIGKAIFNVAKKKKHIELRIEVHSKDAGFWLPPFEEIEELLNQYNKEKK